MNPIQVIALATRVTRACTPILTIGSEELEEAARFQLNNRTGSCSCGQCPTLSTEEIKALEASAAMMLAAAEFLDAVRHAHKTAEAALQVMYGKKKHS